MTHRPIIKKLLQVFLLAGLLTAVCLQPGFCQNTTGIQTILVLPPTLRSLQEMEFLRKGIVDMLAGRLTLPGKVAVITPPDMAEAAPASDGDAARKARAAGADYVILQTTMLLGESVSTDARVLEADTGRLVFTFSRAGQSQADVINHVDQLATEVNARLFGRVASQGAGSRPLPPPGSTAQQQNAEIYQHPEKLIPGMGSGSGGLIGGYGDPSYGGAKLLMRGRRMNLQIRGVTVGDVDGDGTPNVVCIDSHTVVVFRVQQGRLVRMAQIAAGTGNVGVDAADLNGNGRAELFVTHFDNNGGWLNSYVLEWDGAAFQRIADNLRWYFRLADLSDRGQVLVGQRQGIESLFGRGIFEIEPVGGSYEGVQKINLPKDRNVFGFAQGEIQSRGATDLVDFSRGGYLRVREPNGIDAWTSVESYGGTANSLIAKAKDDPERKDILYLPSRVHLLDFDGDGLKEIVSVRNIDVAGAFSRTRLFKQGRLEILKWDQLGLVPLWRTRSIARYIGDFAIGDVSGDGKPEIIAAVVQKSKTALSEGSSYLAVFSLDQEAAAQQ